MRACWKRKQTFRLAGNVIKAFFFFLSILFYFYFYFFLFLYELVWLQIRPKPDFFYFSFFFPPEVSGGLEAVRPLGLLLHSAPISAHFSQQLQAQLQGMWGAQHLQLVLSMLWVSWWTPQRSPVLRQSPPDAGFLHQSSLILKKKNK